MDVRERVGVDVRVYVCALFGSCSFVICCHEVSEGENDTMST